MVPEPEVVVVDVVVVVVQETSEQLTIWMAGLCPPATQLYDPILSVCEPAERVPREMEGPMPNAPPGGSFPEATERKPDTLH